MYEIINLMTGELEESGFETYEEAQRYFEANLYNWDTYGIEGPANEDERDPFGSPFDDPSYGY